MIHFLWCRSHEFWVALSGDKEPKKINHFMAEFPDALYNTILLNQSHSIISNKIVPYTV